MARRVCVCVCVWQCYVGPQNTFWNLNWSVKSKCQATTGLRLEGSDIQECSGGLLCKIRTRLGAAQGSLLFPACPGDPHPQNAAQIPPALPGNCQPDGSLLLTLAPWQSSRHLLPWLVFPALAPGEHSWNHAQKPAHEGL